MTNIYGSCVSIKNQGVLFLGDSGSGKSDIVLRLIAENKAFLVADDRVDIKVIKKKGIATAPKNIKGLLEVRGVGIIKTKSKKSTSIQLVVKLTQKTLERMPKEDFYELCGIKIPLIYLNPFEISATAKVLAKLSLL